MKRVFPVIHLVDKAQVQAQAKLCYTLGADGIFLIDMGGSQVGTDTACNIVRDDWPDAWLGTNRLGWKIQDALEHAQERGDIQGLWSDYGVVPQREPDFNVKGTGIETFCAAAFKTQGHVAEEEYADVVRKAAAVMDVVTTSGPGTGRAADAHKLKAMRAAADEVGARLAVASGVSPANAHEQLAHVDDVLLATGIEESFGYIDYGKLERVIQIARERS